jgi:hypothetical protein
VVGLGTVGATSSESNVSESKGLARQSGWTVDSSGVMEPLVRGGTKELHGTDAPHWHMEIWEQGISVGSNVCDSDKVPAMDGVDAKAFAFRAGTVPNVGGVIFNASGVFNAGRAFN